MTPHSRAYRGVPESVAAARAWTAEVLTSAGCDTEAIDNARLIVSELAGNAVAHTRSGQAGGFFEVRLYLGETEVHLEVADQGGPATDPAPAEPDPGAEHGRGLLLAAAFALRHGVYGGPQGRTLYADIPTRRPPLRRRTALENLRRALEARGVRTEVDRDTGTVTARGGGREITLRAENRAWRCGQAPHLQQPFGREWVLSGLLRDRLGEPRRLPR